MKGILGVGFAVIMGISGASFVEAQEGGQKPSDASKVQTTKKPRKRVLICKDCGKPEKGHGQPGKECDCPEGMKPGEHPEAEGEQHKH